MTFIDILLRFKTFVNIKMWTGSSHNTTPHFFPQQNYIISKSSDWLTLFVGLLWLALVGYYLGFNRVRVMVKFRVRKRDLVKVWKMWKCGHRLEI